VVIQGQKEQAARDKPHARRYIAAPFDANKKGEHLWDGMEDLIDLAGTHALISTNEMIGIP